MGDYFDEACAAVERPITRLQTADDSFWRKDEPELVENSETGQRSIIRGGMWGPQREWWDCGSFVKLLVGGYGCGKTHVLARRMIANALENAPAPVAIVSPTFPLARQTIVATVIELLQGKQSLLGRGFWWRYNKATHEFRIRYRGRQALLIIYSGEDPLSLRGPNLAAAGIDEPFIQDEEVFTQMIARVRHPDAVNSEILLTGTPESLNWGYELATGEWQDKMDITVVTASTRKNKALSSAYISRLEAAFDGKAGEAYIEGKFRNLTSGAVYYAFDRDENVRELPIPENAELGCGMDFNVDPMSGAVFWRSGSHIHFFEEHELPNADTEFMCEVLREKYGSRLRTIYPDATGNARKTSAPGGKTDFYYIREAGFDIDAPYDNPKQKDRFNAVNGKLKNSAGAVTLTVSPNCPKLIKYLAVYSHDLKHKQKHMSHLLDAFSYPVARLFPVTSEIFRNSTLSGY